MATPIVFPNLPDEPRRSSSPGQRTAKPHVELAPQPAPVDYRKGEVATRRQYEGWYLDWADKINFGLRIPGPHKRVLRCWAVSQQHAEMLLHKKAKDMGIALGGVQDIHPIVNKILGA